MATEQNPAQSGRHRRSDPVIIACAVLCSTFIVAVGGTALWTFIWLGLHLIGLR